MLQTTSKGESSISHCEEYGAPVVDSVTEGQIISGFGTRVIDRLTSYGVRQARSLVVGLLLFSLHPI